MKRIKNRAHQYIGLQVLSAYPRYISISVYVPISADIKAVI